MSTTSSFVPAGGLLGTLPLVEVSVDGPVLHLRMNRTAKRNAINDDLIRQIHTVFIHLPEAVRAVVLSGAGDHFCAGLDLSELAERTPIEGAMHSRSWHGCFQDIQYGRVPVVAALHGAVVGGGLEIASACHIRVADDSAYFGFPEGQRGIFVGGGGSVRVPRLMGAARMADMMLTGRVLDADEGERVGLCTYRVPTGQAVDKAVELARRIAQNAPLSTFAVLQALPRIADLPPAEGFFLESLMAGIAQGDEAAKERLRAFLSGKAGKVKPEEK